MIPRLTRCLGRLMRGEPAGAAVRALCSIGHEFGLFSRGRRQSRAQRRRMRTADPASVRVGRRHSRADKERRTDGDPYRGTPRHVPRFRRADADQRRPFAPATALTTCWWPWQRRSTSVCLAILTSIPNRLTATAGSTDLLVALRARGRTDIEDCFGRARHDAVGTAQQTPAPANARYHATLGDGGAQRRAPGSPSSPFRARMWCPRRWRRCVPAPTSWCSPTMSR